MRLSSFLTTAAALMLTGTIALAQSVIYDFDRTANFAAFRTYAWTAGTPVADQINHARIVDAVSAQLTAKGLIRVDRLANPDLLVAYHAAIDRDVQVNAFASGWGPYRLGGGSAVARAERIYTGSLAVEIVNARTHTIVWRGIASKELDVKADPAKRDRNINRAAAKLFRNYPPAR